MKSAARQPLRSTPWALLCGALLVAACSKHIGDDCKTSVDCSQEGDRACDISQPGGYCTIEGCDERTCPSEAVCIRFFPTRYLTKACRKDHPEEDCAFDELCLQDGRCAPRSTERRFCAYHCTDNGDCRGGYECRKAGTEGTMALVANPATPVSFCAPHEQ